MIILTFIVLFLCSGIATEIEKLLKSESIEELLILSLAVGENFPDWKYA